MKSLVKTYFERFLLACLGLLLSMQTNAQVNLLKISFNTDTALIGDYMHLNMQATYKNGELFFPVLNDSLGNGFEIIERGTEKVKDTADLKKKSIDYTLTQFDEGMYQFDQLPILFKNNNGTIDTINSNPFSISVLTIQVDTLQEIKPIKSVVFPKHEWQEFIPIMVLFILIIAIIVFAVYIYKKYGTKKESEKVLTIDDIYKNTLAELEKLKAAQLWKTAETKEHHLKLSDLLRSYLESRYDMLALESTTQEIMAVIYDKKSIDENSKEMLNQILIHCDFVKFAKWKPDEESAEKIMNETILLVHQMKPIVIVKEDIKK